MSTKEISRLVVLIAVLVFGFMLIVKLIRGTAGIVGSLFNLILGIVVAVVLICIVIWMFWYANKKRKK
jgi:prolipoprotein diacylglyceryltransferase